MRGIDLLCANATTAHEVVIAAPYLKRDALQIILDALAPTATLRCVSRWRVEDFNSGASDIECFDKIIQQGGVFYLHGRLHAKYFRFDNHVFIGSANITRGGLGLLPLPNLEILYPPDQSFDAGSFEDEMFSESIILEPIEANAWRKFSDGTRQLSDMTVYQSTIFTTWAPTTREPHHVWLAYNGRGEEIVSADQRKLATLELEQLNPPDRLENEAFYVWLAGRLLSSERVHDTRLSMRMPRAVGWDFLVSRWEVNRSSAARSQSTVANWLRELVG